MTPTKAKMVLNRIAHCRTDNCPPDECSECDYGVTEDDCNEAIEKAIEALEKQLPKEPVYKKDDIYVKNQFVELPHCPTCNWEVSTGDMHCFMCGQAIDWGREQ